jgi:hypothetical protein
MRISTEAMLKALVWFYPILTSLEYRLFKLSMPTKRDCFTVVVRQLNGTGSLWLLAISLWKLHSPKDSASQARTAGGQLLRRQSVSDNLRIGCSCYISHLTSLAQIQ